MKFIYAINQANVDGYEVRYEGFNGSVVGAYVDEVNKIIVIC